MSIATADLYEAAFYLVNGGRLDSIEATGAGKEIHCRMIFTGAQLEQLQVTYLHGHAAVNLFAFRRAYRELNGALLRAKREAKQRLASGSRS